MDPGRVQSLCDWMSRVLGEPITSFQQTLISGRRLCQLMADTIPVPKPTSSLHLRDNRSLQRYLRKCARMGITALFDPADLVNGTGMDRVLANLEALRHVWNLKQEHLARAAAVAYSLANMSTVVEDEEVPATPDVHEYRKMMKYGGSESDPRTLLGPGWHAHSSDSATNSPALKGMSYETPPRSGGASRRHSTPAKGLVTLSPTTGHRHLGEPMTEPRPGLDPKLKRGKFMGFKRFFQRKGALEGPLSEEKPARPLALSSAVVFAPTISSTKSAAPPHPPSLASGSPFGSPSRGHQGGARSGLANSPYIPSPGLTDKRPTRAVSEVTGADFVPPMHTLPHGDQLTAPVVPDAEVAVPGYAEFTAMYTGRMHDVSRDGRLWLWNHLMTFERHAISSSAPKRYRRRLLRALVRAGIPDGIRGEVWCLLCGAGLRMDTTPVSYFHSLLRNAQSVAASAAAARRQRTSSAAQSLSSSPDAGSPASSLRTQSSASTGPGTHSESVATSLAGAQPSVVKYFTQIEADLRRTMPNLLPFPTLPSDVTTRQGDGETSPTNLSLETLRLAGVSVSWPYSCLHKHQRPGDYPPGTEARKESTFVNKDNGKVYVSEDSIRRVLQAWCLHCPTIGYCQGLNFIVAHLLRWMGEEEAFWVLSQVIEKLQPERYYSQIMAGAVADQTLMLDYVEQALPRLKEAIVSLGGSGQEPAFVAMRWFLCLYTNPFPPKFAARVWDGFLMEGPKVLFRTGLALFRQSYHIVCTAPSFGDAMTLLEGIGNVIRSPSEIAELFGGEDPRLVEELQAATFPRAGVGVEERTARLLSLDLATGAMLGSPHLDADGSAVLSDPVPVRARKHSHRTSLSRRASGQRSTRSSSLETLVRSNSGLLTIDRPASMHRPSDASTPSASPLSKSMSFRLPPSTPTAPPVFGSLSTNTASISPVTPSRPSLQIPAHEIVGEVIARPMRARSGSFSGELPGLATPTHRSSHMSEEDDHGLPVEGPGSGSGVSCGHNAPGTPSGAVRNSDPHRSDRAGISAHPGSILTRQLEGVVWKERHVVGAMVRTLRALYLERATALAATDQGFGDITMVRNPLGTDAPVPSPRSRRARTPAKFLPPFWACYYATPSGARYTPTLVEQYVKQPGREVPAILTSVPLFHDDPSQPWLARGTLGGSHLVGLGAPQSELASPHDPTMCFHCNPPHRRSDGTVFEWPLWSPPDKAAAGPMAFLGTLYIENYWTADRRT